MCKFRRTGNVGAFADVNEVDGGFDPVPWNRHRLQPAQAKIRLHVRRLARSEAAHGVSDGFDVRRGGAAAAADDVQPAVLRPVLQLRRECFRCLRKTGGQQRIGQARVGISADVNRRDKGKFFDARAKFLRSQGAVHADAEQGHVRNGVPERFDGLAGKAAFGAGLNESDRGHQGNDALRGAGRGMRGVGRTGKRRDSALFEQFQDREERGLGNQRVENRFDQQKISATIQEPLRLFVIGGRGLIKRGAPRRGVVGVGREGRGLVRRTERAGDEANPIRVGRHHRARCAPGALSRGDVDLPGQRLQSVVGERQRLRVKGVGFDEIGAGFEVLPVDCLDESRLRQAKQVVQPSEVFVPVIESFAAVGRFVELVLLHHGAHGAVKDHDAFSQQALQLLGSIRFGLHAFSTVRHNLYLNRQNM